MQGWQGRDVALGLALAEAGAIVIGLSLLAWKDGIDILTDGYREAFKVRMRIHPNHYIYATIRT